MKSIDSFSYKLGAADCFCEMVRAGVKKIALAHPCDSREERELLCTHLASADVSWYGGTEAFGAILDRLAGESGTSGELAELIQTEWKSLQ